MLRSIGRSRLVPAAALAAAAAWSGCGRGADLGLSSVLVVETVEIAPASITLVQRQTHTFVASARTSSGVPVTGRAVTWSSSNPAVATVDADGAVLAIAPGITRITALIDGVSGFSDVTVSTVPVDRIELLPATTAVVVGSTVQLTANVYDSDGGGLTGRLLTWSSSDALIATVSSTGLVTTNGVGQVTITAAAEGKTGSATITVSSRPPARLGFLTPPADAVAGLAFAPAVRVAIQDATGATVSAATDTVTIALGSAAAGAALSGTLRAAAVNGVATFADLSLTKAGAGYTLVATGAGLTDATSGPFAVRPAPAARLALTTQPPATGPSATPLVPQPVAQIVDQFANPIAQAGVLVTASLATGTGTLGGATATTTAGGAAAFTGLTINGVPGTYALAFSAPGLTAATSTPIVVVAGSATRLVFTAAPPATATNGQPLNAVVTVALRDGAGNPVTQAGVAITAAIASGAGTLSGPPLTATTDAAGTASFAGLVITGLTGPYALSFSGAGVSPLASAPIQLAAGPPVKLLLAVAPPATGAGGQPLVPAPAVQIADASDNPVPAPGVQVAATLASGTGTLTGANASTSATGLASFAALSIVGPAGNYTISFEAQSLTGVKSGTITLTVGAPAQVTFTVSPPATATNGQALMPQPVLQLRDAGGAVVPLAGIQVTASATGLAVAGGTVSTDASGVATFASLSLAGVAGNHTLVFTAANVAGTASSPIALAVGPATQLTFTTAPPATAMTGQPLAIAPVVQLRDAGGNAVAEAGVPVSAAIASGQGGTLSGTLSVPTGAGGSAGFPDLVITGQLGTYTLSFSTPGIPATISNPVTLQAGPPATISLAAQPSTSAKNDEVFSQQPVVTVTDANGNPAAGVAVMASIASGPQGAPTLGGTVSVLTSASGTAAFTNLEIVGPVGDYTLQFAVAGLTTTSGLVTLSPGVETTLVVTQEPTNVLILFPITPAPTVELRDSGNNLVPLDGRAVTASLFSGNGTFLPGSTLVVQTSGGIAVFSNIAFLLGGGNQRLAFSSPGVSSAVSVTFRVN